MFSDFLKSLKESLDSAQFTEVFTVNGSKPPRGVKHGNTFHNCDSVLNHTGD